MPTDSFWREFEAVAARLVRPMRKGDRIPEREVVEAEQQLGVHLPLLLREYYLKAGRFEEVNEMFNALTSPEELEIRSDVLVFYQENQEVCIWGIRVNDLKREDPPVYQGAPPEAPEWYLDQERLSDFLLNMLYWQAANGGCEYGDVFDITEDQLAVVRNRWPRVRIGRQDEEEELYSENGQVLYVLKSDEGLELLAAARTQKDYDSLLETLGIEEG